MSVPTNNQRTTMADDTPEEFCELDCMANIFRYACADSHCIHAGKPHHHDRLWLLFQSGQVELLTRYDSRRADVIKTATTSLMKGTRKVLKQHFCWGETLNRRQRQILAILESLPPETEIEYLYSTGTISTCPTCFKELTALPPKTDIDADAK